jgi:MinD-like ATPase involved in chromosome partitioning or flagellar assembly
MSKIVSVHSYRGGTGKSNVSANVAAQLAARGRRVAVVDTDIQSPGIHVLFNLEEDYPGRTLNDYLWGRCRIAEAAVDVGRCVADGNGQTLLGQGSLHLVPSSVSAGEIARILQEGYDINLLNDGFHELIEALGLDYLIVDTHPGLNEETLLSIAISDILVLILRPDHQDYQGTAVTLEVARRLNVPDLFLVVNKALPSFDFNELRTSVSAAYKATVEGVLPLSEEIIQLGSGGLYSLLSPQTDWAQTIAGIAARIDRDA